MTKYVKVTLNTVDGQKTMWAKKVSDRQYLECHKNGNEWFGDTEIHLFVVDAGDVVSEFPAQMNRTYGLLEVVK